MIIIKKVKKHIETIDRKKVDFIHCVLFFAILESLKWDKPLKYLAEKRWTTGISSPYDSHSVKCP